MISENILSGLYHLEDALTRVKLGGQSNRRGFESLCLYLFLWLCQLSSVSLDVQVHRNLCHLNLHHWFVWESPSVAELVGL